MKDETKDVILLVGLPRSGKSTLAQEIHRSTHYPIVCPDDFREALHGEAFVGTAERSVWASVFVAARALLLRHDGIVVDACNRSRARRDEWRRELKGWGNVLVAEMPFSKEVSLERAADHPELLPIIERMASGFERTTDDEEPYVAM